MLLIVNEVPQECMRRYIDRYPDDGIAAYIPTNFST